MKNEKWTPEIRKTLYSWLLWVFGPLKNWEKKSRPFINNNEKFENFMCEAAEKLNINYKIDATRDRVMSQLNYVLQEKVTVITANKNTGYMNNFIKNRAAALEVGFIDGSHRQEHSL